MLLNRGKVGGPTPVEFSQNYKACSGTEALGSNTYFVILTKFESSVQQLLYFTFESSNFK